jgi:hypothetical protein
MVRKAASGGGKYCCSVCDGTFATKGGLTQHTAIKHGSDAKTPSSAPHSTPYKYTCSHCHWKTDVFNHIKLHWKQSCPPRPEISDFNPPDFDPALLASKESIPQEYLENDEEKLRYEWVAYFRNKAGVVDDLHLQE